MDQIIKDPAQKTNVLFLILGIMLGMLLGVIKNYMCDAPTAKRGKQTADSGNNEEEDEWEDEEEEDSEDADASNANEEQSPEKDKALFAQYPIDDVKMMLAVRSDLGMTKGKIGAQVGHATLGGYHTIKKWA